MRNKRIYAADPHLNELAHTLNSIHFPTDEAHSDRYQSLLHSGPGDNFHNTTPRGGKAWAARFFLGGQNRIVGIAKNHLQVCRFADMAAVRFWVYKVRNAAPPIDAELNFGLDSVAWDTANVPAAVELLDVIEQYLVASGVFPSLIRSEEQRKQAIADSKAKRRTVCNEVESLRDGVVTEIDKLGSGQSELKKLLLQMAPVIVELHKKIDNLTELVRGAK